MKINIKSLIGNILIFFITLSSFPPMIITSWNELKYLNLITKVSQLLIFIWCLLSIIQKKRRIKDFKFWLPIFFVFFWTNISNLLNENNDISFYITTVQILGYVAWLKIYYKSIDKIINVTSIYCIIIVVLNIISQIVFPNGIFHSDIRQNWQPYYVCGNPNSFIFFYLFAEYIVLINSYRKKGKITFFTILFSIMMIYSLSIVESSTGLIITILSFFIIIFSNKFFIKAIIKLVKKNYKIVSIMLLFFAIWIIAFKGWNNKFVLDVINNISSDGNNSFKERGFIWNNSIELIKESPLIGYGTGTLRLIVDIHNIERSAHNTFLQLALFSGIPALIGFMVIIYNMYKNFKVSKNIELYFSISFFSLYLITFLVEQNPFYIGFYTLIVLSNILYKESLNGEKNV